MKKRDREKFVGTEHRSVREFCLWVSLERLRTRWRPQTRLRVSCRSNFQLDPNGYELPLRLQKIQLKILTNKDFMFYYSQRRSPIKLV